MKVRIQNTEKMKVMKEVRLFGESDGRPVFPIENKAINAVVWRIVLQLREWRYSMGRIDTLDVVFSSVLPYTGYDDRTGKYNVGVSEEDLCSLIRGENTELLFSVLEMAFLKMFCVSENLFRADLIVCSAVRDARAGEDCRTNAVKELAKRGALTSEQIEECRYDSRSEIVEFIIHSEEEVRSE